VSWADLGGWAKGRPPQGALTHEASIQDERRGAGTLSGVAHPGAAGTFGDQVREGVGGESWSWYLNVWSEVGLAAKLGVGCTGQIRWGASEVGVLGKVCKVLKALSW